MKRFAVYKRGGKLFAEFATMDELVRVLRVSREDVFECLNGLSTAAFTRKTTIRPHRTFRFMEVDTTKTGQC